jgi:uncharacterized PurR-regulated membrane protein YhhQ (DUF165 family)
MRRTRKPTATTPTGQRAGRVDVREDDVGGRRARRVVKLGFLVFIGATVIILVAVYAFHKRSGTGVLRHLTTEFHIVVHLAE